MLNVRRLFGSGEYLRAWRLFDSSAKSSTLINVIPTFHEEELRSCVCHAAPGRKTDARRTLDERRRDARQMQMRRGRSDRLFLSSTVAHLFHENPHLSKLSLKMKFMINSLINNFSNKKLFFNKNVTEKENSAD